MKTLRGDLLDYARHGRFDVIVHGCNCQCAMGKGIAKQIRVAFPEAYQADIDAGIHNGKLGMISAAVVTRDDVTFTVVNAYTQWHWRGLGTKTDYDAIRHAFRLVKKQYSGQRIAYPRIGAGLGGGGWAKIAAIIDAELAGEDHTLIEWWS